MLKKIILCLIIILLLLPVSLYFIGKAGQPVYEGTVKLSLLEKDTVTHFDNFGIPHIEANSESDAYKVLGWLLAQDRLFQIDIQRRAATGTLSEVFGSSLLKFDKRSHIIGFKYFAEKLLSEKSTEANFKSILLAKAFLSGINSYIKTQKLPIEFYILGYKPKPFTLADVIAFIGYMGFRFSEAPNQDLLFSKLHKQLDIKLLKELTAGFPLTGHTIIENTTSPTKSVKFDTPKFPNYAELNTTIDVSNPFLYIAELKGSNSWVLSGKMTKSGKPILANDPHIGVSNPSLWFEAHLETPNWHTYGHFLSYVPFPIIAHNRKFGWAVTISEIDDLDLFNNSRNPDIPSEILVDGKYEKLSERNVVINVRGGKDVTLKVESSRYGPVIDPLLETPDKSNCLSLKWSYLYQEFLPIEPLYEMNTANNYLDFAQALGKISGPGINISYADTSGNIAWWIANKIPIRKPLTNGMYILDGENSDNDWKGFLNFSDNPKLINPAKGYIITANNPPSFEKNVFPGYFQDSSRPGRIKQLLDINHKFDSLEIQSLQNDNYVFYWLKHKQLLKKIKTSSVEKLKILKHLISWDGLSHIDSQESSIYHLWLNKIYTIVTTPYLSEKDQKDYYSLASRQHFINHILENSNSPWWSKSTRLDIVSQAFESAADKYLSMEYPKWGDLHAITFTHPIGKIPGLGFFFNIGPFPVPGGPAQINAMDTRNLNEIQQITSNPSTRYVLDFNDLSKSAGILPTGNSGNLFSKHYNDQVDLYLNGSYRKQLLDWELIKNQSPTKLIFSR